jgi:hypothetical protein
MGSDGDLGYTRQELLDYLPPGWALEERTGAGVWNSHRNRWEVTLRDIADVDWRLTVDGRAAAKAGRIEALKQALDGLYREALGGPGLFG